MLPVRRLLDVCLNRLATISSTLNCVRHFSCSLSYAVRKDQLDFSKFPTLNEDDLDEQFIKGGGPGGQKVNKAVNCVQLKHIPTGIIVKVHHSRFQAANRKIARETLLDRLDEHLNGALSVANQKKRLTEDKSRKSLSRRAKIAELKQSWKEREGLS